jgi:hypothetical protein
MMNEQANKFPLLAAGKLNALGKTKNQVENNEKPRFS